MSFPKSSREETIEKHVCKHISLLQTLSRILLALLLAAEVAHISDDLLYAVDPLFRLHPAGCHQVQIFLASLEDDGETSLFNTGLGVFVEPLRLTALAHRINVINGDCLERGSRLLDSLVLETSPTVGLILTGVCRCQMSFVCPQNLIHFQHFSNYEMYFYEKQSSAMYTQKKIYVFNANSAL